MSKKLVITYSLRFFILDSDKEFVLAPGQKLLSEHL
jgi:hypothetical protein